MTHVRKPVVVMSEAVPPTIPLVSVIVPARDPGPVLPTLLKAISEQQLESLVEVVVVDDASFPVLRLPSGYYGNLVVRLLRQDQRQGRAKTRNAGAAVARGEYLLFLDADCIPTGNEFLQHHLWTIKRGRIASCGEVATSGDDFWDRYQSASSAGRRRKFAGGLTCIGSAANLMVSRSAFVKLNGFDTSYVAYGFEDRDLLARMAEVGSVGWCENASVVHHAEIRLRDVALKLAQAGKSTAPLFSQRHPIAYRALGYAAVDATIHPWLSLLARGPGRWTLAHVQRLEPLLHTRWLPYFFRSGVVRIVSALAFLYGTTSRKGG